MKTIAIALAATICFVFRLDAESPDAALKDKLVGLEKQSWEAWKNHDGNFFQDFLSNDHVEVGFGGVTNKSQVVAGVSSGVCTIHSYSLDHFELRVFTKELALLTYRETQETACAGKPVPAPCWVSSWYAVRDDRWQNIAYQQSQIAK